MFQTQAMQAQRRKKKERSHKEMSMMACYVLTKLALEISVSFWKNKAMCFGNRHATCPKIDNEPLDISQHETQHANRIKIRFNFLY